MPGPWLVLLALVALAGCRGDGPPEGVAPTPGVDVVAYGAAVRLDPATLRLEGVVRLRFRRPRTGAHVSLALDDAMRVRTVRLDGRPASFTQRHDALLIQLDAETDTSTIEIRYGGVPRDGLYAREAAGQRVVYTDGWPQRGAGWLPAVHHPADPALFALAVEVPAGWEVVGSGTPGPVTDAPGGYRRWPFRLARAAPAYTFAFAVADFAFVDDASGTVPVRHALLAADSARAGLLARVPAALDTLSALLGPYPYGTFTTVEVPLDYDGMEDAGAPFLRAGLYTAAAGRTLEEVAFHEAAHQWTGNRFGPADWRDLWLAEGAATYLTTVVYERLDGAPAAREHRVAMSRLPDDDARRALLPARLGNPSDALSGTVYGKGGSVFHLLRLKLGDRAFYSALRTLTRQARPTTTAAFRAALERASGQDLSPFFAYWVSGTNIPTLTTAWDEGTRTLTWRVTGDAGTLRGLPFELRFRQREGERFVDARTGRATLPGDQAPLVDPVGVVMRVER